MSIEKRYLRSQPICKVTFRVKNGKSLAAETIKILGDFNQWDPNTPPMQRLKNGEFKQVINLSANKEYQFRYLVDNVFWDNDLESDRLVPNGIEEGDYNSVIVL